MKKQKKNLRKKRDEKKIIKLVFWIIFILIAILVLSFVYSNLNKKESEKQDLKLVDSEKAVSNLEPAQQGVEEEIGKEELNKSPEEKGFLSALKSFFSLQWLFQVEESIVETGCTNHEDCLENQLCVGGGCVDKLPLEGERNECYHLLCEDLNKIGVLDYEVIPSGIENMEFIDGSTYCKDCENLEKSYNLVYAGRVSGSQFGYGGMWDLWVDDFIPTLEDLGCGKCIKTWNSGSRTPCSESSDCPSGETCSRWGSISKNAKFALLVNQDCGSRIRLIGSEYLAGRYNCSSSSGILGQGCSDNPFVCKEGSACGFEKGFACAGGENHGLDCMDNASVCGPNSICSNELFNPFMPCISGGGISMPCSNWLLPDDWDFFSLTTVGLGEYDNFHTCDYSSSSAEIKSTSSYNQGSQEFSCGFCETCGSSGYCELDIDKDGKECDMGDRGCVDDLDNDDKGFCFNVPGCLSDEDCGSCGRCVSETGFCEPDVNKKEEECFIYEDNCVDDLDDDEEGFCFIIPGCKNDDDCVNDVVFSCGSIDSDGDERDAVYRETTYFKCNEIRTGYGSLRVCEEDYSEEGPIEDENCKKLDDVCIQGVCKAKNPDGEKWSFNPGDFYCFGEEMSVCCGNGIVEEGEECDDWKDGNNSNMCSDDCLYTYCGDGILQFPNGKGLDGNNPGFVEECELNIACSGEFKGQNCDEATCKCTASPVPPTPTPPSSCFPAGTKILMADGNKKNIEDVKIGDSVLSYDIDLGINVVSEVLELEAPVRSHMCRIEFNDGLDLELTNEHPVYTLNGWKSISPKETLKENPELLVGELGKQDLIFSENGYKIVKEINCWNEIVQTYNLKSIKQFNNYFAEEILVHNKGSCEPKTCEDDDCGVIDNGCGGTIDCGGCNDCDYCDEESNKCISDVEKYKERKPCILDEQLLPPWDSSTDSLPEPEGICCGTLSSSDSGEEVISEGDCVKPEDCETCKIETTTKGGPKDCDCTDCGLCCSCSEDISSEVLNQESSLKDVVKGEIEIENKGLEKLDYKIVENYLISDITGFDLDIKHETGSIGGGDIKTIKITFTPNLGLEKGAVIKKAVDVEMYSPETSENPKILLTTESKLFNIQSYDEEDIPESVSPSFLDVFKGFKELFNKVFVKEKDLSSDENVGGEQSITRSGDTINENLKSGCMMYDFYADWCGSCRAMNPTVEKLVAKGHAVKKVNIDTYPNLKQKYSINNIPAFVFLNKDGKEFARVVGGTTLARLEGIFEKCQGQEELEETEEIDETEETEPKPKPKLKLVPVEPPCKEGLINDNGIWRKLVSGEACPEDALDCPPSLPAPESCPGGVCPVSKESNAGCVPICPGKCKDCTKIGEKDEESEEELDEEDEEANSKPLLLYYCFDKNSKECKKAKKDIEDFKVENPDLTENLEVIEIKENTKIYEDYKENILEKKEGVVFIVDYQDSIYAVSSESEDILNFLKNFLNSLLEQKKLQEEKGITCISKKCECNLEEIQEDILNSLYELNENYDSSVVDFWNGGSDSCSDTVTNCNVKGIVDDMISECEIYLDTSIVCGDNEESDSENGNSLGFEESAGDSENTFTGRKPKLELELGEGESEVSGSFEFINDFAWIGEFEISSSYGDEDLVITSADKLEVGKMESITIEFKIGNLENLKDDRTYTIRVMSKRDGELEMGPRFYDILVSRKKSSEDKCITYNNLINEKLKGCVEDSICNKESEQEQGCSGCDSENTLAGRIPKTEVMCASCDVSKNDKEILSGCENNCEEDSEEGDEEETKGQGCCPKIDCSFFKGLFNSPDEQENNHEFNELEDSDLEFTSEGLDLFYFDEGDEDFLRIDTTFSFFDEEEKWCIAPIPEGKDLECIHCSNDNCDIKWEDDSDGSPCLINEVDGFRLNFGVCKKGVCNSCGSGIPGGKSSKCLHCNLDEDGQVFWDSYDYLGCFSQDVNGERESFGVCYDGYCKHCGEDEKDIPNGKDLECIMCYADNNGVPFWKMFNNIKCSLELKRGNLVRLGKCYEGVCKHCSDNPPEGKDFGCIECETDKEGNPFWINANSGKVCEIDGKKGECKSGKCEFPSLELVTELQGEDLKFDCVDKEITEHSYWMNNRKDYEMDYTVVLEGGSSLSVEPMTFTLKPQESKEVVFKINSEDCKEQSILFKTKVKKHLEEGIKEIIAKYNLKISPVEIIKPVAPIKPPEPEKKCPIPAKKRAKEWMPVSSSVKKFLFWDALRTTLYFEKNQFKENVLDKSHILSFDEFKNAVKDIDKVVVITTLIGEPGSIKGISKNKLIEGLMEKMNYLINKGVLTNGEKNVFNNLLEDIMLNSYPYQSKISISTGSGNENAVVITEIPGYDAKRKEICFFEGINVLRNFFWYSMNYDKEKTPAIIGIYENYKKGNFK